MEGDCSHKRDQVLRYCIEIKCADCGQIITRKELERVLIKDREVIKW